MAPLERGARFFWTRVTLGGALSVVDSLPWGTSQRVLAPPGCAAAAHTDCAVVPQSQTWKKQRLTQLLLQGALRRALLGEPLDRRHFRARHGAPGESSSSSRCCLKLIILYGFGTHRFNHHTPWRARRASAALAARSDASRRHARAKQKRASAAALPVAPCRRARAEQKRERRRPPRRAAPPVLLPSRTTHTLKRVRRTSSRRCFLRRRCVCVFDGKPLTRRGRRRAKRTATQKNATHKTVRTK